MTEIPKPRPQLRSWRLPGLVLFLLALQVLFPYRGWQVLLVGLAAAWLLAYLWARSLARGLHLTRVMRFGWVQVGDHMLERFQLANDGWAPAVWAEVIDYSTLPDYQAGRGVEVGRKQSVRWHVEALCTRRGLYTLGPTSVRTGDPFGLYTVTLHYPDTLPLLVLPPVVPLPAIEVSPGGKAGDGRPRPNAPERTISVSSVREYVPGDSLRWVHWRTSARRDDLFVRLFDGVPASDWWILLDMDRHVQLGEGADATEEHAVILAASLADKGLQARQAVGLAAYGEQWVTLPPHAGKGQRWSILRSLALVSLGWHPLSDLLAGMAPAVGSHTSLVIVTPSVDLVWLESLVRLMRRGVTPTVLLLDPISFGGKRSSEAMQIHLTDLGVAHYVITRDVLDRPEARPGMQHRWGRPVRGSDQLVPSQSPHEETSWRIVTP